MSKREKIIVGCMIVAVIYGAYSFLFDSSAKKSLRTVADSGPPLQQYVIEVINQLKKADASTTDGYLLDQAQGTLNKNPFYREASVREETNAAEAAAEAEMRKRAADEAAAASRLSYTGYIEMGSNRLAILNGSEFSEGELINADGMVLRKITPTAVVIGIPGLPGTTTIKITESK